MRPDDASRAAAATTVLLLLDSLPRADVTSDAATQVPRASFQMLLKDLFIASYFGATRAAL
jgi:hypothetical protein